MESFAFLPLEVTVGFNCKLRLGFTPQTLGYRVGYGRPQTLGSGSGQLPVPLLALAAIKVIWVGRNLQHSMSLV